jgi:hypothetical protein
MAAIGNSTVYLSRLLAVEPRGTDQARTARPSRPTAISLLIVAWIAIVDLCWPRTNLAILYVVPLLLIASWGDLKSLRRTVSLIVVLTFAVYFLKNTLMSGISIDSYFDYRLANRTMVGIMIVAMGQVLRKWIVWLREQPDLELPAAFRDQDQEISETLAILCCAPLIAVIAAIDFLAPANYNLAILYPIPLFICGWTRKGRLAWAMLGVLLILTVATYEWGTPPTGDGSASHFVRNRVLAALGMICVTTILTTWMRKQDSAAP